LCGSFSFARKQVPGREKAKTGFFCPSKIIVFALFIILNETTA
jgi:hypothetical protein